MNNKTIDQIIEHVLSSNFGDWTFYGGTEKQNDDALSVKMSYMLSLYKDGTDPRDEKHYLTIFAEETHYKTNTLIREVGCVTEYFIYADGLVVYDPISKIFEWYKRNNKERSVFDTKPQDQIEAEKSLNKILEKLKNL